jgi:hypothetical protein
VNFIKNPEKDASDPIVGEAIFAWEDYSLSCAAIYLNALVLLNSHTPPPDRLPTIGSYFSTFSIKTSTNVALISRPLLVSRVRVSWRGPRPKGDSLILISTIGGYAINYRSRIRSSRRNTYTINEMHLSSTPFLEIRLQDPQTRSVTSLNPHSIPSFLPNNQPIRRILS